MSSDARLSTELLLENWRSGPTLAERLAATILALEGYSSIDPQAPLGGPDGKKDILCSRSGKRAVAACYFPGSRQEWHDILAKFRDDIEGATNAGVEVFAFVTNQRVTLTQRSEIDAIAGEHRLECDLFHLERVRSALDSPRGYGARLGFLHIPMSEGEQVSFWETWKDDFIRVLASHSAQFEALKSKLDSYVEERARALTTVTTELAFLLAAFAHLMKIMKSSDTARILGIGFSASHLRTFELVSTDHLKYLEQDKSLDPEEKERRKMLLQSWRFSIEQMCRSCNQDAGDQEKSFFDSLEGFVKQLDPKAHDFKSLVMEKTVEEVVKTILGNRQVPLKILLLNEVMKNADKYAKELEESQVSELSKRIQANMKQ